MIRIMEWGQGICSASVVCGRPRSAGLPSSYNTPAYKTDGDLVTADIRFLSYFTDLSNVLVALAMTLPWLAPDTSLGRFFTRPSVRTAILAYIIIVAVLYHFVLAKLRNPEGWELVADTIEHIVAPALYLIDWVQPRSMVTRS